MIRRCLELLSRGRVFRRTMPSDFGNVQIYVSPDSQLKYLKRREGAFDADLLAMARDYVGPSQNVWDIGANVGVFTFAAANLIGAGNGKVLAVEADIWLAQLIYRSCALNMARGFDITVLPVAASERAGVATFRIAARGRACNALSSAAGSSMMGGVRELRTVPTLTLDILLQQTFRPDFVKIDVEGAEKLVLDGAGMVLRDVRPSFYIEVDSTNTDAVTDIFRSHLYQLVDGESRERVDRCTRNTLALPLKK